MVVDWALVVVTGGLVAATLVLAWFTRSLWRATVRLGDIENKRDEKEVLLRRWKRVRRKLELADLVIGMIPEVLLEPLVSGEVFQRPVDVFRELYYYVDFEKDKVLKKDMDRLLLAFDGVRVLRKYPGAAEDLGPVLENVKKRLSWDLVGWREELVKLSLRLSVFEDDV